MTSELASQKDVRTGQKYTEDAAVQDMRSTDLRVVEVRVKVSRLSFSADCESSVEFTSRSL